MSLGYLESEHYYPHLQVKKYLSEILGIDEYKLVPYLLGQVPLTIEEAARIQKTTGGKLKAERLLKMQRKGIKHKRYNFK